MPQSLPEFFIETNLSGFIFSPFSGLSCQYAKAVLNISLQERHETVLLILFPFHAHVLLPSCTESLMQSDFMGPTPPVCQTSVGLWNLQVGEMRPWKQSSSHSTVSQVFHTHLRHCALPYVLPTRMSFPLLCLANSYLPFKTQGQAVLQEIFSVPHSKKIE